jgi:hypothetical protein
MFNIGDRVKDIRNVRHLKEEAVIIIAISKNRVINFNGPWRSRWRSRYHLKYLDVYNAQGTNMLFWVDEDDIILDKEYYRNEKLNQLV